MESWDRQTIQEEQEDAGLYFGLATVAAITVLCYLICLTVRTFLSEEKYLPPIAGIAGGILGVLGMRMMNDYPASDYLTAAAVGVVSGLAAAGLPGVPDQF